MSSSFDEIGLLTAQLDALERLDLQWEKCDHSSAFIFEWIFFIRAGKKDNHRSLNEFEFLPDSTADYKVTCP